MFASTSYPLPLTAPFPTYAYDAHANSQDYIADYEEKDPLDASSCQFYYPSNTIPYLPSPLPLPQINLDRVEKREVAPLTPPEIDNMELITRGKMDMGMAESGTVASQAGIQTPLGQYAAQMVVWLWHGTHAQSSHAPSSPHTSPLINSPNPFEPSTSTAPLNPLQVAPTPEFAAFVERLLRVTMVSHSVTLIALLYIYRLKMRNNIFGEAGSEQRPFVVSLILGNKYLDDNTYTNKTWADLAGLKLDELNRMEAEFLRGLDNRLGVDRTEYQHWRSLLDGFVFARQREAEIAMQHRQHRPSWSPVVYTPTTATVSQVPNEPYPRARSASPLKAVEAPYAYPSPLHRKRTALDAFSADPGSASIYEQMRLPARKAHFSSMDMTGVRVSQDSPSGLGRSSSLNRRIARLPGAEGGRRGSVGHVYGMPADNEDLRHTAALHWQQAETYGHQWEGCSVLAVPYQRPVRTGVPPSDHLMFYQLAAEAHPGHDGAPRKAILHYEHRPSITQYYAPQSLVPVTYPAYAEDITHLDQPYPAPMVYGYAVPQPAQFANAGPPGYAYDPSQYHNQPAPNHTGLGITAVNGYGNPTPWSEQIDRHQPAALDPLDPRSQDWRSRSQWSSPLPGQFNPHIWQQHDQQ